MEFADNTQECSGQEFTGEKVLNSIVIFERQLIIWNQEITFRFLRSQYQVLFWNDSMESENANIYFNTAFC